MCLFILFIASMDMSGFSEMELSLIRNSQDNVCNNYGSHILEMYKSNALCIANERVGTDLNYGKTTCKNASVIDFVIVSPTMFLNISELCVKDFDILITFRRALSG